MFSLASVATMAACIFLFGIFFCVVENFQHMVREMEKSVAVTVFFDEGLSQEQIDAIGEQIRSRTEVADVVFVTAEEAWDEYKEIYFEEAPELADGFEDDNPLANEAHYEIYLTDVESQDDLVTWLESVEGIRRINESAQVADILTNFNLLIGYISIAVILLLLCVSVFLISNTVTIGIAVRKEEIAIMKLIGATNGFVKAPFVVEGLLIGLVGAAIPLAAVFFLYRETADYVTAHYVIMTGIFTPVPIQEMMPVMTAVALALGGGIGFFGSFFTIRKHLRV